MNARTEQVLSAIDRLNAADPSLEPDAASGTEQPVALLYGQRMSAELARVFPDASEHLVLAARGQHVERWKMARDTYPDGRDGYLAWRRAQAAFHAERVAGLMRDAGYGEADCARVGTLLRKEGLKRDAEVQRLEDVICFVFLRWYFKGFAEGRDSDHVHRIASKTARKMSAEGRARALAEFDLPARLRPAFEA